MAYDLELADRIRAILLLDHDVVEKRMFGGLAFLIGGHIAVGVSGGGGLLMRCEPDEWEELMAQPHVGPLEMQGRAARGWIRVSEDGVGDDEDLCSWVEAGVGLARSLPPKQ